MVVILMINSIDNSNNTNNDSNNNGRVCRRAAAGVPWGVGFSALVPGVFVTCNVRLRESAAVSSRTFDSQDVESRVSNPGSEYTESYDRP